MSVLTSLFLGYCKVSIGSLQHRDDKSVVFRIDTLLSIFCYWTNGIREPAFFLFAYFVFFPVILS